MAKRQFKCKVCGYIHVGDKAPEECPVCKAPASEFEEIKTRRFNKENNLYIVLYMTIIIVLVSLMLSITSGALKSRQDKNVELDKKKQILSSLNLSQVDDAEAAYNTYITKFVAIDGQGKELADLSKDFNHSFAEGEYPLYYARIDGATKYILPLNGVGLWGAIWGYIALNEDCNTVYGVYFSHAGETPGLGANITQAYFQEQFQGKHILDADGRFVSIAVMKAGQKASDQEQVDAISGGTITSKGVETMLQTCISNYVGFFQSLRQAQAEQTINE